MSTVLVQINGISAQRPCNIWLQLAAERDLETVWYDDGLDIRSIEPEFAILQHIIQVQPLIQYGLSNYTMAIGSCGDAASITCTAMVFQNLPLLAQLYIEGYDYLERYDTFSNGQNQYANRMQFFKICSDTLFPPLSLDKKYDWCFIGQVYPEHEERLNHNRNIIVKELDLLNNNGLVGGDSAWSRILGRSCVGRLPQSELNSIYASSKVVVSVDAHNGNGYTSTRTIEAMHAGHCVCIHDHAGTHSLKRHLVDREHVFYFHDAAELADIIGALDTETAAEMGRSAREVVLREGWTYTGWLTRIANRFIL